MRFKMDNQYDLILVVSYINTGDLMKWCLVVMNAISQTDSM